MGAPVRAAVAPRPGPRWTAPTVLLLAIAVAGCRSYDPVFWDEAGQRAIAELPPAPLVVAVAPVDESRQPLRVPPQDSSARYAFTHDASRFRARLIEILRTDMHAATAVIAVADADEAQRRHADLLVQPRVRASASIDYQGRAGARAFLADGLWLVTWFTGLWVEDCRYDAKFALDLDLVNPHDNLPVLSLSALSETVDLAFWDRNPVLSWGTPQSWVMPPFLTHDHTSTTSSAITERICQRLAAQLAKFLKEELPRRERELLGQVELTGVTNGAEIGDRAGFTARLTAAHPFTEVAVFLDHELVSYQPAQPKPSAEAAAPGEPVDAAVGAGATPGPRIADFRLREGDDGLPDLERQWVGDHYRVDLPWLHLPLDPGVHRLAIEFQSGGQFGSRTLTIYGPPTAENVDAGGPP